MLQLTAVNHYLDLSIVYGNSDQVNQQVRSLQGGKLITEQRNSQEWLPRNQNVSGSCTLLDPNEPCYMAGEIYLAFFKAYTIMEFIIPPFVML